VGREAPVVVSHLQFTDDTLLIRNKSWANVRALRAGHVLFEAMSGLKVNFHKSSLVGLILMPLGCQKRLLCWVAKWVKSRSSTWGF